MTTPATGSLSMSQINTELSVASTTTQDLNAASVRSLATVPSGAISFSNLRGKSNAKATGTMTAGSSSGYVGYNKNQTGSLTNSLTSNAFTTFAYFDGSNNTTTIYTSSVAGPAWTTNPSSISMTMNGVTATMPYSSGAGAYVVTGNVFNIVTGVAYNWSYK